MASPEHAQHELLAHSAREYQNRKALDHSGCLAVLQCADSKLAMADAIEWNGGCHWNMHRAGQPSRQHCHMKEGLQMP